MWDSEAYLISIEMTTDDIGDIVETVKETHIFCNELSVGQSEFYQAHAQGLKPEIKLEINKIDYSGEKKVKYEGTTYKVMRTFTKDEKIEITLEGDVHVGS